jgi:hypothetical protein
MEEGWLLSEAEEISDTQAALEEANDGDSHEPSGESLEPLTTTRRLIDKYVPVPTKKRAKPLELVEMLPSDYEEEDFDESSKDRSRKSMKRSTI